MILMKHFFRAHTYRATQSRRVASPLTFSGCWSVLGLTAIFCLGISSEGIAAVTTSSSSRTFYAVQGGPNPGSQWFNVYSGTSTPATLTVTDNATWLRESLSTTTIINQAKVTAYVNTTGLVAGTYKANITIKVGTWGSKVVPVTLILSPSTTSPPPSSPPPATSTATLRWNATTGTVSGYKIYVGEAPRLYTRTITVSNVTSSTVNNLTIGRMYYFAVTAYNSAGESSPSNEVSKTIR